MKSLFLLVLVFIYGRSLAQLPEYYVRLVTGKVFLVGSKKKASPVTQKQFIFLGENIELKEGAELTLVNHDGNFLILNKAGRYEVVTVRDRAVKKINDDLTAKYLKLAFHESVDPHEGLAAFKNEHIEGAKGGVSRGDGCDILVFPVKDLKTSRDTIVFRWYRVNPTSKYSYFIYDSNGKELFRKLLQDTVMRLNLKETLPGIGRYFWSVIPEEVNCESADPFGFDLLASEKEKQLVSELLKGSGSSSIEEKLSQIDRLLKNGFIDVASSRYLSLINEYPEDKNLLKSYVLFLFRFGFDDEAAAAWK